MDFIELHMIIDELNSNETLKRAAAKDRRAP
jgi:hypothetical protein